jgi:ligand-binding sensor domain-containing protein
MSSKVKFALGALAALLALAAMFGFSIRSYSDVEASPEVEPAGEFVIEAAPEIQVGESVQTELLPLEVDPADIVEEILGTKGAFSEAVDPLELDSLDFDAVRDVQIVGNQLLLATAGGVVKFFPGDTSFVIHSFPQGLTDYDCHAVLQAGNEIYVGTNSGVFRIDELGVAEAIWPRITERVNRIAHVDDHFLVGTVYGLYRVTDGGVECLLAEKCVIDLTENRFGLWAATAEDGVLHFDGEGWRLRWLRGDTTAFAEVNCFESAFQRLWVGTPKGVYVFDGGSWELIGEDDNLYAPNVLSIARGRNFIYFGTTNGVFSYYDGSLCPLDWSEGLEVASLAVSHGRYLVGTPAAGATFRTPQRQLNIQSLFDQAERLALND